MAYTDPKKYQIFLSLQSWTTPFLIYFIIIIIWKTNWFTVDTKDSFEFWWWIQMTHQHLSSKIHPVKNLVGFIVKLKNCYCSQTVFWTIYIISCSISIMPCHLQHLFSCFTPERHHFRDWKQVLIFEITAYSAFSLIRVNTTQKPQN